MELRHQPTAPMALLRRLCFIFFTAVVAATAEALLVPLTHTLSTAQHHHTTTAPPSPYHLLKAAALRSTARHRHRHQQRTHQEVSLPLSFGSDYSLSFSVGRPVGSQTMSLYMDTGSDLVWLPCSPFECILCEGKPPASPHSAAFNQSTPVSCLSSSCSAVHSSLPASDLCAISGCPLETIETSSCSSFSCPPFYYAYGDGSLVGRLRQDHMSIPSSSKTPIQIPKFIFGCAHTTLAEPIGVAGFGRGVLSLPAQLAQFSPHLGKRFSYCLNSHSFDSTRRRRPSPLILGRNELRRQSDPDPFVYTRVLDNPKRPYYYSVSLAAISIGFSRIPASAGLTRVDENGDGGFVVDSGTTFTMLPEKMYKPVVAEFSKRMWRLGYRRATHIEEDTGLGPCYHHGDGEGIGPVPSLTLHFGGNASVALPRRNYYRRVERKSTGCLMLMNGGDDADGGPAGTLGNIQQQGFEVVYDLEARRVGFARRRCAELWASPATDGDR